MYAGVETFKVRRLWGLEKVINIIIKWYVTINEECKCRLAFKFPKTSLDVSKHF